MAGTTGLEPATSAVTGQRSNQTELRPQIVFQQLRLMSHRIKRFAEGANFASFYLFVAVGAIFRFSGDHVNTKTVTATTEISLSDEFHFL